MDEKEWIKRIVAGDTQMFSCLVAKYERMAYTIAFRILGNKEEAEEATQDAFVRMYRALPRFQFESKFSTWFYRIVYRVAISAVRQRHPLEEVPVETAEAVTPDERDSALRAASGQPTANDHTRAPGPDASRRVADADALLSRGVLHRGDPPDHLTKQCQHQDKAASGTQTSL